MARWVIQKFSSFPRKNFGDRIRNEIMFIRNKSHGEENFEGFERRDKYRRRIYVSPVFFVADSSRKLGYHDSFTVISRNEESCFGMKFLKWQFEVNGQPVLTAQSTFTEDGTAFGFLHLLHGYYRI